MIKLSKLTDYAVVILAAMARREESCVAASTLAEDTALPEPTVAKVLKLLVKGGIVNSVRGVNGGYGLASAPARLRISDIIAAMEGPIALTSCVKGSHETCAIEALCQLHGRWNVVNTAIRTALDQVMLADMLPSVRSRAPSTPPEERAQQ